MAREPVRLYPKKEKNTIEEDIEDLFKTICIILKEPMMWIIILFILLFAIMIGIAISESISYFVYNTGGIL